MPRRSGLALLAAVCLALAGCNPFNRKVEPYDAAEKVEQPDLSKIFPEGAERAMSAPTQMPPSPEELMGAAQAEGGAASEGAPIRGVIRLAAGASAPPGSTLFVIARTGAAGPPTAVLRLPAPRFPYEFSIGPEQRMIAAMPWEGPFQLSARIDLDGNAMTRDAGGLEGRASAPASPGDEGVAIELSPAE
jgi:hypothetical protein